MIVTFQEVDVTPFLPNQPVVFLERAVDPSGHNDTIMLKGNVAAPGIWYVSNKAVPVADRAPFEWREQDYQMTRIGDLVRIPLFHYQTGVSAATLFATGAVIGAVLAAGLPPELQLRRVHLAVGQVFHNDLQQCYDAYIGIALQLDQRRG